MSFRIFLQHPKRKKGSMQTTGIRWRMLLKSRQCSTWISSFTWFDYWGSQRNPAQVLTKFTSCRLLYTTLHRLSNCFLFFVFHSLYKSHYLPFLQQSCPRDTKLSRQTSSKSCKSHGWQGGVWSDSWTCYITTRWKVWMSEFKKL